MAIALDADREARGRAVSEGAVLGRRFDSRSKDVLAECMHPLASGAFGMCTDLAFLRGTLDCGSAQAHGEVGCPTSA